MANYQRTYATGLIWLLQGRRVVALTDSTAAISKHRGGDAPGLVPGSGGSSLPDVPAPSRNSRRGVSYGRVSFSLRQQFSRSAPIPPLSGCI